MEVLLRNVTGLALVFLFVLVAGVGCMKCGERAAQKISEKALEAAIEKGTGGKADIDVSGNVDLSGLPAFALYPGAKGKAKWSMSGEQGKGTAYTLETSDPRDKVVAWYKNSIGGAGFKQVSSVETDEATSLICQSEDKKQTLNVTVTSEEGKTVIVILHAQES